MHSGPYARPVLSRKIGVGGDRVRYSCSFRHGAWTVDKYKMNGYSGNINQEPSSVVGSISSKKIRNDEV